MRDRWNRSGDEETYFTEEKLRRLSGKVTQWLNTPTYAQVPEPEKEAFFAKVDLKNNHPKARLVVNNVQDKVRNYTEAKDYPGGLEIVNRALDTQVEKLPLDEQAAARRRLLSTRGHLHECRGTFEMAELPLSDPRRKAQFLQAVESYMDADLQVECGLVTDYALRLAEAAGGAELPDLQVAALAKIFGNNNFVLADKGDAGVGIMIQDLMIRAKDSSVIGSVPGGGDMIRYSDIHLPDEHSN